MMVIGSMKNFMVLMCLATLTGCAGTSQFYEPMCVKDQPVLTPISIEDQWAIKQISEDLLIDIAVNQQLLLDHIFLMERLARVHNEQFEAECI